MLATAVDLTGHSVAASMLVHITYASCKFDRVQIPYGRACNDTAPQEEGARKVEEFLGNCVSMRIALCGLRARRRADRRG
jgi:hypothetical protein